MSALRHPIVRRRTAEMPEGSRSRLLWRGLIAMAGGGQLASPARRIDFRHELVRASARAWQDEGFAAVKQAEAFIALGLGACECGDPARREGMLVQLSAAATALDVIATARATDLAQRTWNREAD